MTCARPNVDSKKLKKVFNPDFASEGPHVLSHKRQATSEPYLYIICKQSLTWFLLHANYLVDHILHCRNAQ